ncbi:MAG: hypothetical protein NZ826_05085 [Thermodesulfovibrio sp.]|nr:hypothetical protein [Thermodesulfovibrio sp.]MDW7971983.1 CheR family methyltransferase [Thermodesulfovibrio sp.]
MKKHICNVDFFKETLSEKDFKILSSFIEKECGIQMPPSKKILLESRLRKRLRALGFNNFKDYINFVFNSNDGRYEIVNLIDVVTTNKTEFFREKAHFDFLLKEGLPNLLPLIEDKGIIKVWSAACSSGEEPYSILITLSEFAEVNKEIRDFYVLGTDICTRMLEKAREAIYPMSSVENIPFEILKKYFLKSKDKSLGLVKVIRELREKLHLKRLNLMDEVYDIKDSFHIVFCRNVLIYFSKENQIKIIKKLIRHLITKGYLILGHSETVLDSSLALKRVGPSIFLKLGD